MRRSRAFQFILHARTAITVAICVVGVSGCLDHSVPSSLAHEPPTYASRPKVICGTLGRTLSDKIDDCARANPSASRWEGYVNEINKASWTLVSAYPANDGAFNDGRICAAAGGCREVWRDDRTSMLWSDLIDRASTDTGVGSEAMHLFNWCWASGANNMSGSPYPSLDPDSICGNDTETDTGYQYANTQLPVSLCAEDANYLQTPSWANDEKAGMLLSTSPAVSWQLPTIEDWKQAERNLVRWVLPNVAYPYWSSSLVNFYAEYPAWFFNGYRGDVYYDSRYVTNGVRCVGRPRS